jgi:hypothetical protein
MSDDYQVAEPVGVNMPPDKASGMAITALVLGILGLCCCGFVAGIPALVIGFMERGKINRGEASAKGMWMAIVGIVLGIISSILGCLQVIWIFFFGGMNVIQQMSRMH